MKKEDLVKRFKEEFPEFNWEERYDYLRTNFALAQIQVDEEFVEIPMGSKKFIPGIKNLIEDEYDVSLTIDSINEEILDKIIKGIKCWEKHIDKLRKSKNERDQLIFIHPGWDIESFKKDFKIVVGENVDWRLGIMSTGDWDFSNDELCTELQENSGDCFGIGPFFDQWDDSLEEALENWDLTEAYEELKKKYSNVELIKDEDIYDTDLD